MHVGGLLVFQYLLPSARRPLATSGMDKDIIIYHNDLTDSDNWATARFLQRATLENPSIDVIWIVEPRPVSLGLYMTKKQIDACRELLELYFPSYEDSYKLLRGGFLQQSDLDKIEGLTKQHRDLVIIPLRLSCYQMLTDLLYSLSSPSSLQMARRKMPYYMGISWPWISWPSYAVGLVTQSTYF